MSMTTSAPSASRWLIFTPAVNRRGEVDHDCLMARVHRLFLVCGTLTFFMLLRLAHNTTPLNFALFVTPLVAMVLSVEIDERIAESTALKMSAVKHKISFRLPDNNL